MNILEFLASIVASLAWPSIVLILAIRLQRPIADLIVRLRKLKHRDTEFEFEKEILRVEDQLGVSQATLEARPIPHAFQYIEDLISVSPRAAIIESWLVVEHQLMKLYREMTPDAPPQPIQSSRLLRFMKDNGHLDEKLFNALDDLRDLRNKAAHYEDFNISSQAGRRYIALLYDVMDRFAGD